MFKLLLVLWLVIQSEEKNNGRPGLKISKTMAFNKRTLLIQESLMLQLFNWKKLLKILVWLQLSKICFRLMNKWSQLLVTQPFLPNQPQQLQQLRSLSMSNLLQLQALVIQFVVRKIGNNGLKTLKTMAFNKRWLLIPEFPTSLLSNFLTPFEMEIRIYNLMNETKSSYSYIILFK